MLSSAKVSGENAMGRRGIRQTAANKVERSPTPAGMFKYSCGEFRPRSKKEGRSREVSRVRGQPSSKGRGGRQEEASRGLGPEQQ